MKFYLDEDPSPKIAEILRRSGIDALSAHEAGMCEVSDQRQLDFAAMEKRCLAQLPHSGERNALFMRVSVFFSHYVPPRAKS